VIVIDGLSKNVHKGHLEEIFRHYGRIILVDLPTFAVCELFAPFSFRSGVGWFV